MTFVSPLPRIPLHSDEAYQPEAPDEDEGRSIQYATLRSKLLTADELDGLADPEWLIDDVLVEGSLAFLYGKPGCGKSFFAVDWWLSVAAGDWWAGRETARGPALYIAGEGAAGLKLRKQAWCKERGIDSIPDAHLVTMPVNLLSREWTAGLVELCQELRPRLVIVDTLNRSMPGGDENAAKDASVVVAAADKVRAVSDTTVLFIHHDGRSGANLRGSQALDGAADTVILCRADGELHTLKCEKQKDSAEFDDLTFTRSPVAESCVMRPTTARGTNPEGERQLLEALWHFAGTEGLHTGRWEELAEMPRRSFYRHKKSLVSRGEVVNVGTDSRPRWRATTEAPDV